MSSRPARCTANTNCTNTTAPRDPNQLDARCSQNPAGRGARDRRAHPTQTRQQAEHAHPDRDEHSEQNPAADQLVPEIPASRRLDRLFRRSDPSATPLERVAVVLAIRDRLLGQTTLPRSCHEARRGAGSRCSAMGFGSPPGPSLAQSAAASRAPIWSNAVASSCSISRAFAADATLLVAGSSSVTSAVSGVSHRYGTTCDKRRCVDGDQHASPSSSCSWS
jgi:hypothetical protein